MRSHNEVEGVPLYGHCNPTPKIRREAAVGYGLLHPDAGWPLAGPGTHKSCSTSPQLSVMPQDSEHVQAMPNEAGNNATNVMTESSQEEHSLAEKSSGALDKSFDVFRHEVDELLCLTQFGFLKPCRQLEKNYYGNRRTAGLPIANVFAKKQDIQLEKRQSDRLMENDNSLHNGNSNKLVQTSSTRANEGMCNHAASEDDKLMDSATRIAMHQIVNSSTNSINSATVLSGCKSCSSRTPPSTEQQGFSHCSSKSHDESRGQLKVAETVHCRFQDCDARIGNTIRELLSMPSKASDGEQGSHDRTKDVSFRKFLLTGNHVSTRVSSSSPDFSSCAYIPFKWEEEPGKPKSIAAASQRALARKLSRDGIEPNSFVEGKSSSHDSAPRFSSGVDRGWKLSKDQEESGQAALTPKKLNSTDMGSGDTRRSASFRYSGKGHVTVHSRDNSWGMSSARCSIHEKEAQIDLVAPAAAKFLIETFDSPLSTPARHDSSPPAVAIPFKWEDAPGKAKADTVAEKPHILQLPPRLAVPSHRSSESLSRELRASVFSHPLAGLFSPCMAASSPVRQQDDPTWMHNVVSKTLPLKTSHSHDGFAGHCSSCPRDGRHSRMSKSADRALNQRKVNKSFSQPLTATESLNVKPRRLFSSELKSSHPLMQQATPAATSSPSSIRCGSELGSRQSSSSNMYLSCELEASTPRTAPLRKSISISSSSASYESIGEHFDRDESASPTYNKSYSSNSQRITGSPGTSYKTLGPSASRSGGTRNAHGWRGQAEAVKSFLKLCKNGNCLGKSKSRQRLGPLYSPEVWAPTLATYFQRLEVNEPAMSNELLDKQGAPTSSGYLNSKGEPVPLNYSTSCPPRASDESSSPEVSPERPTRLPYKMPSVAEQELAARKFRKAPSLYPDDWARPGTNSNAGSRSLTNTPARLDMYWAATAQVSRRDELCPSPAYTAALELLSPAVNLMSRRRKGSGSRNLPTTPAWSGPKPHRRVQFLISICKTLKRVLFRQPPRRSVIGTRLMNHDERAPSTFQFSKPN